MTATWTSMLMSHQFAQGLLVVSRCVLYGHQDDTMPLLRHHAQIQACICWCTSLSQHSTAHRLKCLRHACTRKLTRSRRQSRVDTRKAESKARVACTATVVPGVNASSSRNGLRGQPQKRLRTPSRRVQPFLSMCNTTPSPHALAACELLCARALPAK